VSACNWRVFPLLSRNIWRSVFQEECSISLKKVCLGFLCQHVTGECSPCSPGTYGDQCSKKCQCDASGKQQMKFDINILFLAHKYFPIAVQMCSLRAVLCGSGSGRILIRNYRCDPDPRQDPDPKKGYYFFTLKKN
jgi:hypothetical protein